MPIEHVWITANHPERHHISQSLSGTFHATLCVSVEQRFGLVNSNLDDLHWLGPVYVPEIWPFSLNFLSTSFLTALTLQMDIYKLIPGPLSVPQAVLRLRQFLQACHCLFSCYCPCLGGASDAFPQSLCKVVVGANPGLFERGAEALDVLLCLGVVAT